MKAILTLSIAVMAVGSIPLLLVSPLLGEFTLITAAVIAVLKK